MVQIGLIILTTGLFEMDRISVSGNEWDNQLPPPNSGLNEMANRNWREILKSLISRRLTGPRRSLMDREQTNFNYHWVGWALPGPN